MGCEIMSAAGAVVDCCSATAGDFRLRLGLTGVGDLLAVSLGFLGIVMAGAVVAPERE